MTILNPCCCCSLQAGTKTVAMINILLSIVSFVALLIPAITYIGILISALSSDSEKHELSVGGVFGIIFSILALLFCFIYFILSIVLYNGADQRNYGKCRVWFIVSIIFLIFYILNTAKDFFDAFKTNKSVSYDSVGLAFGFLILGISVSVYELWVVRAFMQELRVEKCRHPHHHHHLPGLVDHDSHT